MLTDERRSGGRGGPAVTEGHSLSRRTHDVWTMKVINAGTRAWRGRQSRHLLAAYRPATTTISCPAPATHQRSRGVAFVFVLHDKRHHLE